MHRNRWFDRHVAGSNLDKVVAEQLEPVVGKPAAVPPPAELELVELRDSDYEQPSPCEYLLKQRCL